MPHVQTESKNPARDYRLHGGERPTERRLKSYIHNLSAKTKPETLIVVADMLIDRAMQDPNRVDKYLGDANLRLAIAAQRAAQHQKTDVAIRARLHRAELPAWRQAARGEDVDAPYYRVLSAAVAATHFLVNSRKDRKEVRKEIRLGWKKDMSSLVGARALDQGIGGWLGRSALEREAGISDGEHGEDWGCAVILSPTADNFDDPPLKLQVQNSFQVSQSDLHLYHPANTLETRLPRIGVGDPLGFVYGSLQEIDCLPDHANPVKVFDSKRLNEITGNWLIATLGNLSTTRQM